MAIKKLTTILQTITQTKNAKVFIVSRVTVSDNGTSDELLA